LYIQTITEVADKDWEGFVVSGGSYDKAPSQAQQNGTAVHSKGTVEHLENIDVHQVPAGSLGTNR
jgi:hypothetical protein